MKGRFLMQLEKTTLHIGLEKPVRLLHVTDSHIGLADERDNERKRALAARLSTPEKALYLEEHIAYAKAHCDLLVHTGDLMDFVSHANVEKARQIVADEDFFFIAGNHDYSQYVGEAWEDNAYRMNSYMEMGYGLGVPNDCTYLVGCDEEHLLYYNEFRAVQQRPTEATLRFIDYVKHEPLIKAILTGHLHFNYTSMITDTLPQYVTGGGYDGIAREVTII